MFLSELEAGTQVLLSLTIEGRKFEFETTVHTQHKQNVFFVPVRKDSKILNVNGPGVEVDVMLVRQDEKPILWRETGMVCSRYKHELFYSAKGALKGKEFNRRGAYRLFVGEEIHAKIGHDSVDRIVILKDISNTGFGFIYPQELEDAHNAFVYMTYSAKLGDMTHELPFFGKVVREMKLKDGRMLYGCALVKKNDMIGHYISQKQMELLAKKKESFVEKNAKKDKK